MKKIINGFKKTQFYKLEIFPIVELSKKIINKIKIKGVNKLPQSQIEENISFFSENNPLEKVLQIIIWTVLILGVFIGLTFVSIKYLPSIKKGVVNIFATKQQKELNDLKTKISALENKNTLANKTTFYVKSDNANLRNCPSENGCSVISHYAKNSEIYVTGSANLKLADLPEWIRLTTLEGNIAYINKAVLSETPVIENTNNPVAVSSNLNDTDRQRITDWTTYIDNEIQSNKNSVSGLSLSEKALFSDAIELLDTYNKDIGYIGTQFKAIYNDSLENKGNAKSLVEKYTALSNQYYKLRSKKESEVKTALQASVDKQNDIENKKLIQRINNQYEQLQAQQDAINQARIDAANARAAQYNAIRAQGASEGVTAGVVNNQLKAAGLINQITCSTSPVGGMTPSGGSITCY